MTTSKPPLNGATVRPGSAKGCYLELLAQENAVTLPQGGQKSNLSYYAFLS